MNSLPCSKCGEIHEYCTAHLRRKKGSNEPLKPCRKNPVKNRKVCELHGGKTPSGADSPHFLTGDHSKYLKEVSFEKESEFHQKILEQNASLFEQVALINQQMEEMISLINDSGILKLGQQVSNVLNELKKQRDIADQQLPVKDMLSPAAVVPVQKEQSVIEIANLSWLKNF